MTQCRAVPRPNIGSQLFWLMQEAGLPPPECRLAFFGRIVGVAKSQLPDCSLSDRSLPRRLTRPSPGHRPSTSRDPGVWKSFKKSADSKPMVPMAMLCWMSVLDNQGGCRSLRDSNVLLNGSCAGSYGPDNVSTEHDGNAPTEDYNFPGITFLNAEECLARLREPR